MERVIEVFVELDGTSRFVGRLWSRSLKWRTEAKRIGVAAEEIDRMATAFEHDEMVRAQRFSRSVF